MARRVRKVEREEMISRFSTFFREYKDDEGNPIYLNKLRDLLTVVPKRSLSIDWNHLNSFDPELAEELLENPEEVIASAEDAVQIVLREDLMYNGELKIHARFFNLQHTLLVKELGSEHINRLIQVEGIITRVSEVKPFVEKAVFVCKDCGNEMIRLQRPYENLVKPAKCDACGSRNIDLDVEKSRFVNFQSFRLQDRPESLKGGQMPRFVDAILLDDMVDAALPGDRVLVTGILRVILEQKDKRPIFKKVLEVNHIEQLSKEIEELEISPEDEQKIRELAKRKDVVNAIVDSIAPAIWGHKTVKKGIALALFGGVQRTLPDGTKLRGESHVLLVGDPGVAKSQLLRYVANLAPRAIYTSGKSSSAAGLTAAAVRDEFTGSWVLEAGVLVLADGGFACLHPHSRVLVDGKYQRIEDLFELSKSYKALSDGKIVDIQEKKMDVVALDLGSMRTKPSKATIIRRKPWKGELLRIKLRSGNEVTLTPDHFLIDGQTLEWKEAEKFGVGDRIVAPLKLPPVKERVYILDILSSEWKVKLTPEEKKELKDEVLKRFKSLAEFNRKYDVSRDFLSGKGSISVGKFRKILYDLGIYEKWRERPLTYGPNYHRERLKVAHITPELAYFLGFLYGDGWIKRDGSKVHVRIVQSKVHKDQIEAIRRAFESFYDGQLKEYERTTRSKLAGNEIESNAITFHVSSPLLAYLYEYLTGDNLRNAFSLDDEALKAFVAGTLDSDGCVSIKKSKKGNVVHVEFLLSNDLEKDRAFALLLRRFDVYAHVIPGKGVNKIRITGREDVINLLDALRDYSVKVKEIPIKKHLVSSRSDKVPAEPVKRIAESIIRTIPAKILQERGLWSTLYFYTKRGYPPSRIQLKKILERLRDVLSLEIKLKLEILATRDYFLDEIVSIERVPYDGFVYDLYVPGEHNFAAEGVIVHNCIDEFDKMSDRDRSAIHEALEQQSISISKAGITATLNSRTTVIAAANPKFGRFNRMKSLPEQLDLPPTLLSRFDLIFLLLDEPDEKVDASIAEHILKVRRGEAEVVTPKIPYDLLKKYIAYARKNVHPILSREAMEEIKNYYVRMRRGFKRKGESEEGMQPIPITARQLEALIRLSEAHARMRLSETVTREDARAAIEIIESMLRTIAVDEEGALDAAILEVGKSTKKLNKIEKLIDIIKTLESEGEFGAPEESVMEAAKQAGIGTENDIKRLLNDLKRDARIYEPRGGFYKVL